MHFCFNLDKNKKRQNVLHPPQSVLEQNGALVTRGSLVKGRLILFFVKLVT